jgi:hypothetical protein
VKSVKVKTGTTETKKPDKEEPAPKYEPTESDKRKIKNYRNELLNILIKYEFDFSEEPNANFIIGNFKDQHKNKPVG